jgi:hypothetical protein
MIKVSFFENVRAQRGQLLTAELFNKITSDLRIKQTCAKIAEEPDHEKQQELKKDLPVVTWQAYFEGQRKNELAQPSSLFMLDVDDVDNPYQLWCSILPRREELGILLAHQTPSTHGLRLVAKCQPRFTTLDDCQQWLSAEIGVKHDPACKDWARASYLVPDEYIYYIDAKGLFRDEPGCVYEVKPGGAVLSMPKAQEIAGQARNDGKMSEDSTSPLLTTFKGLPLKDIAHEWLMLTGGEPVMGERNTRLHSLANSLRYITDFDEATLLEAIPNYGLPESEMRSLIHSACLAPRSTGLPQTLERVLQKMQRKDEDQQLTTGNWQVASDEALPPLPPLIKETVRTFPDDFKKAAILCQLPALGALGSKLRAEYLDGHMHSPSFQVSFEAPQANGKSLITDLAKQLIEPIVKRDRDNRKVETAYSEKALEAKQNDKQDKLGPRPKEIVRDIPATISVTKLLMRMDNSHGLHLICVAPEVDEVTHAIKREFANYSSLLRVAFDNEVYGQDYASDNSFSGMVSVYFNTLFCGTPKSMRKLYPDVENGLVSRVLFVTVPDQFGKPMPVRSKLTAKEREEVDRQMARLDAVSFLDGTVQEDHVMDMGFLNRVMDSWITEQREEAIRTDDRTRDTFCRRAAVVGFRAGMLAWFLYGEKDTRNNRKRTTEFARWVATQMLNQHLLRFQIDDNVSNTNRWIDAYKLLGDEFSRDEVERALRITNTTTPLKKVISLWQTGGCIKAIETDKAPTGQLQTVRFKKTSC